MGVRREYGAEWIRKEITIHPIPFSRDTVGCTSRTTEVRAGMTTGARV